MLRSDARDSRLGSPVARVLERLQLVQRSGQGWSARCPAHRDDRASLSIGEGRDGRVLIHCFAGCDVTEVVDAIGLRMSDLFRRANGAR